MAIGIGSAAAQSPAPPAGSAAVKSAPAAAVTPAPASTPTSAPPPAASNAAASKAAAPPAPSPTRAVTIRDPVAAKPCVSATRKLEREKSSLDTAEADVERYRKLEQGCHSKLTCARYAAALTWLDKRVDRHQRRIERFDKGRKDACDGA
jgi:hypothetical protein